MKKNLIYLTPNRARIASGILVGVCIAGIILVVKTIILPLALPWQPTSFYRQSFEKKTSGNNYELLVHIDYDQSSEDKPTFLDSENITIGINSITVPDSYLSKLENKTCLSSVYFGFNDNSDEEVGSRVDIKDVCSPFEAIGAPSVSRENVNIEDVTITQKTKTLIDPFYYPFDRYRIIVPFRVHYQEYRPDDLYGFSAAPDISLSVSVLGWIPSISFHKDQSNPDTSVIQVDFSRPLIYKIMPIVLFGLIFVFIISIIFVADSGSVLEVAVGVLFSLWGVRSILIPAGISGFNFMDVLIFAEYIFLALAITIRFTIKPALSWLRDIYHPPQVHAVHITEPIQENKLIAKDAVNTDSNNWQKDTDLLHILAAAVVTQVFFAIGILIYFFKKNK